MARGDGEKKTGKEKPRSAAKFDVQDEVLWQRVVETLKPLKSRRRPSPKTPPANPSRAEAAAKPQRAVQPKPTPTAKPSLPELALGTSAGVDKRTAQRLGRGQLEIEARLDLHGLTQSEAHARLASFIRRSVAAGKRCVLVITGKGFKATGEIGVLRQSVPRWLNEPSMRGHIVALRHAQLKDGGEGALYVLLRRTRDEPTKKDAPPPKRLTRKRNGP